MVTFLRPLIFPFLAESSDVWTTVWIYMAEPEVHSDPLLAGHSIGSQFWFGKSHLTSQSSFRYLNMELHLIGKHLGKQRCRRPARPSKRCSNQRGKGSYQVTLLLREKEVISLRVRKPSSQFDCDLPHGWRYSMEELLRIFNTAVTTCL